MRNDGARRGITLTEVLVSMGVLSIGLLSVAAMFPVGGHYMRSGDVADRGSAVAQAALADVVTRGMLRPEAWLTYDQAYLFSTRLGEAYRKADGDLQQSAFIDGSDPAVRAHFFNYWLGSIFVLDPLGADSMLHNETSNWRSPGAKFFPFARQKSRDKTIVDDFSYDAAEWKAWTANPVLGIPPSWPVRRVSLPASDGMLRGPVAEQLVRSQDDLALALDEDPTRPAVQQWELGDPNGDGLTEPLSRSWRGDYSWIVTVVPPNSEARDALATDPMAYYYDVSVVVFYKRFVADLLSSERLVEASVQSTGLAGGEVLLEKINLPALAGQDPYDDMRAGEWLMLSGPHPNTTPARPQFFAAWYRIVSIDDDSVPSSATQRLVSLRGPVWPWQPAGNTDPSALANDLRVTIVPGAIAVHNRKMRLENHSVWSID